MVSALSEGRPGNNKALNKAQDRAKPSTTEPKKSRTGKISPQKGNALKEPNSKPNRENILSRPMAKVAARGPPLPVLAPRRASDLLH